MSWSTAVKFLTARKFEVARALALYEQHEATRRREGLAVLYPTQEPLLSELRTGKFTVLVRILIELILSPISLFSSEEHDANGILVKLFQPSRDGTGAAVAIFTAHLHLPQSTTHQTTLQVSITSCIHAN